MGVIYVLMAVMVMIIAAVIRDVSLDKISVRQRKLRRTVERPSRPVERSTRPVERTTRPIERTARPTPTPQPANRTYDTSKTSTTRVQTVSDPLQMNLIYMPGRDIIAITLHRPGVKIGKIQVRVNRGSPNERSGNVIMMQRASVMNRMIHLNMRAYDEDGTLLDTVDIPNLIVYDVRDRLHSNEFFTYTCARAQSLLLITDPTKNFNLQKAYTLTQLQNLSVHGHSSMEADLAGIAKMNVLRYLRLENCGISGNVMFLSALMNLRSLDLTGNPINGDIRFVSALNQLRYLDLDGTNISGELNALSPLGQLESLNLRGTNITGNLQQISQLSSLRRLVMDQCSQIAVDTAGVNAFHQLIELRMVGTMLPDGLPEFDELDDLLTLSIGGANIDDVQNLTSLMHLNALEIVNCSQLDDLSDLAELGRLRSLRIKQCDQVDSLRFIENIMGLKRLELLSCQGITDLSPLSSLTLLNYLDMSGCDHIEDTAVLDTMNIEHVIK